MATAVAKPQTLNSWKEIASYLGRGVRTVQRWEADLQLPVHRIGTGDRSPVFAFKAELDNWMRAQAREQRFPGAAGPGLKTPVHIGTRTTLDRSARLTSEALNLLQKQQAQTKLLAQQVRRMAHLLPTIGKLRLRPRLSDSTA